MKIFGQMYLAHIVQWGSNHHLLDVFVGQDVAMFALLLQLAGDDILFF